MATSYPTTLDSDGTMLIATDFKVDNVRSSMTNSQNTIPVTTASTFPDPGPSSGVFYVTIDAATAATREICSYTGLDLTGGANALTGVVRHLFGTNTTTHAVGVTVEENIVAAYHEVIKSAVVAIETKVGVTGSGVNTTHEFKLLGVATGDKAASLTGAETLTNKTITSLALNNNLIFNTDSASIIPGTTQWALRNNANNASNIVVADAGAVTFRSTVGGITTLTATTLAGTLSTAAQTNVTSVGTLTSLTLGGNLAFSVNNADDIGTSTVGARDLWVARGFQHLGIDQTPMNWMNQ